MDNYNKWIIIIMNNKYSKEFKELSELFNKFARKYLALL